MALLIMRLEENWPYTERNLSLEEAVRSIALCLESSESGLGCVLKKDYVYWHQVLGEIYLHRNFCFLVVWTTKDVAILKIEKDEAWAANIPCLCNFIIIIYFQKLWKGNCNFLACFKYLGNISFNKVQTNDWKLVLAFHWFPNFIAALIEEDDKVFNK